MEVIDLVDRRRRSSGVAEKKEYCRFCLIKFHRRFMIPIFSAETKGLEQQIRSVLMTIEMSPDDQFSNCICIECALKVSTSFNFMHFCFENQKLLRSSHFNESLLVEATDTPLDMDLSHLETRITPTSPAKQTSQASSPPLPPPPPLMASTGSLSTQPQQKEKVSRRRRSTPVADTSTSATTPVPSTTPTNPSPPLPDEAVHAEEEDHPGMALSSMLECQLDEDVEEEPSQPPANLPLALPQSAEGLPAGNPYRCTVCAREFGKKANVLSHFQTQHTNLEVPSAWKYEIEPAKCPLCGDLVECLFAHLEYHAGRRTFKCDSCEWAFYSRNYLSIHTAKLHKADAAVDAKPDRYACKLCPAGSTVCRDYDDLVAHYRQWHLNEMKNKLETCQLCGRETRYLKQHMQKMHNSNAGQFQCHLCDKSYAKARYLQTHFSTAHKDALIPHPLPLDFTAQNYPPVDGQGQAQQPQDQQQQKAKATNAAKRPRQSAGGPVQCVKCQMQFPNNRMLNMHIQRYHNANIHNPVTAEVSVTAIPAAQFNPQGTGGGKAPRKRRRDSVPVAGVVGNGGQHKDMWNNSALSGMLVNMFGGHGHYED